MNTNSTKTHPEPRMPFGTAVPPTIAERHAATERWERRGLLGRLVRHRRSS